MVTFTATVTDSMGASSSATRTVTPASVTPRSVVHRLFRTNVPSTIPLTPDYIYDTASYELGMNLKFDVPGQVLGVSYYRSAANTGPHTVSLWDSSGTRLATKTVATGADVGPGWVDQLFDTPVTVSANTKYTVSYWCPNGRYSTGISNWVTTQGHYWNPPIMAYSATDTGGGGNGVINAGSSAYPSTTVGGGTQFCVDVMFQTTSNTPAFTESFWGRFPNGFSADPNFIPIGVYQCDPPFFAAYKALGINTVFTQYGWPNQDAIDAFISTGLFLIAGGEYGNLDGVRLVMENPSMAALVKGYALGDEFDMASPPVSPADTLGFVQKVRKIDSTRPIFLNLGKWAATAPSSGYAGSPEALADMYGYFKDVDICSVDYYGNMYGDGSWAYAQAIDNVNRYTNGGEKPVIGFVETCGSETGNFQPTTAQIYSATWMMLIHGARGICYFDHQFSPVKDFAWMTHHSDIGAAVSSLNSLMLSLAPVINANNVPGVATVASSNTTAGPIGGVTGVPIDYFVRQVAGKTYIFAIGGRPGAATATFTVPSLPNKTVTVINESRTLTTNSSGVFTDTFAADYQVHLYRIDAV